MCDMPSVYSDDWVKARKLHKCCECRRIIKPGEQYKRFKGCWYGKWYDYHTCPECEALRDSLRDIYDDGMEFGNLSEYAQEAGIKFKMKGEEMMDEIKEEL